MRNRDISLIVIGLFIGAIIGGVIGNLMAWALPEGVVKDFFLIKKSIGWGATANNWVEFGFFRFKTGIFIDLSILSFLGFLISWYLLRYFK